MNLYPTCSVENFVRGRDTENDERDGQEEAKGL